MTAHSPDNRPEPIPLVDRLRAAIDEWHEERGRPEVTVAEVQAAMETVLMDLVEGDEG